MSFCTPVYLKCDACAYWLPCIVSIRALVPRALSTARPQVEAQYTVSAQTRLHVVPMCHAMLTSVQLISAGRGSPRPKLHLSQGFTNSSSCCSSSKHGSAHGTSMMVLTAYLWVKVCPPRTSDACTCTCTCTSCPSYLLIGSGLVRVGACLLLEEPPHVSPIWTILNQA